MGRHQTSVVPTETREFYGSCTCRWRTLHAYPTSQEAEDQTIAHMQLVEKTRAYTRRTQPTLKESRDYYRSMARDEFDPTVAEQWDRLADEIDRRLNDSAPPHEGQQHLW